MTALVAADLTYTITKRKKLEDGRLIVQATIAFGDGAKTYPAGGVPVTKGKLACGVVIDSLMIEDLGGSGYSYQYDKANVKLRMFQSPGVVAHAHPLLLKDAVQADGATTRVNAATGKLGANTGGDITLAAAGASGGVQNNTATADASFNELGTGVAPAAQTLKVTVIGY